MINFVSKYENENAKRFNMGLINREYDKDIVHHVMDSWLSLEVLPNIKVLSAELEEDESEIDINEYINSRNALSKKDEGISYRYIKDSRYGELRVKYKITVGDIDKIYTKKMLIPIADEKGYYTIKGTRYFLLFQLVDASTYVRGQSLILKSIMPVAITRVKRSLLDTDENEWTSNVYLYNVFKKPVDVLIFFFAKMGVSATIKYFGLHHAIRFAPNVEDRELNVYFQINSSLFVEVDRDLFTNHDYVRSIVFMFLSLVTNRLSINDIDNEDYWVEKIGSIKGGKPYTFMERGANSILFFDRMLDEASKKTLKLHKKNKKDIYSAIRWMIQNYGALKSKDDIDLKNKRLRCNEYVASLLTKQFSRRVNRVISLGSNIDMKKVEEIFAFPGDILITQLHKSGLLRFDDQINDMDFFSKLKYTLKGPNSLGGNNSKNMSVRYRGIHPSYLGNIDINVCGTSDPGSSGVLTPFVKTNGLFFDDTPEAQDGTFELEQEVRKRFSDDDQFINILNNISNQEGEFAMLDMLDQVSNGMTIEINTISK